MLLTMATTVKQVREENYRQNRWRDVEGT